MRREDTAREGSEPAGPAALATLQPGQSFAGTYALRRIEQRETRNGKRYFDVELSDASGSLGGKVWDADPASLSELRVEFVDVAGYVETYQDRKQAVIATIAPAATVPDPIHYLPRTPKDIRALYARLVEMHGAIANPFLRALMQAFLADAPFRRALVRTPAAVTNHHAYVGGLLEHIVSLSESCLRIADAYPGLDRDLLVAGAFLHDIGKVDELRVTSKLAYSDRGRLTGHIVQGVLWLEERARAIPGFPSPLLDHLRHLVLSHHGTLEWGSPVKPQTAEAIALHALDNLDAKLWAYAKAVRDAESDPAATFTAYTPVLGGRVYMGAEGEGTRFASLLLGPGMPAEPPAAAPPAAEAPPRSRARRAPSEDAPRAGEMAASPAA